MKKTIKIFTLLVSIMVLVAGAYKISNNIKGISDEIKNGEREEKQQIVINMDEINRHITNDDVSSSDIFNQQYDEDKLIFCSSMEEAIWQADSEMFEEWQAAKRVDTLIKEFESEDKGLLFYESVVDKNNMYFVCAKFLKRTTEEGAEFALVGLSPSELPKYGIYHAKKIDERVKECIRISDLLSLSGYSAAKEDEWFVWGTTPLDDINYMTIDGQAPDEIISLDEYGKTRYFWYYSDLKSNSAIDDMKIERTK